MRKLLIPAVLLAVACAAALSLYALRDGPRTHRVLADVPPMSAAQALAEREDRYRDMDAIEELLALPGHFARMEALYALAGRADSAAVQRLLFQADGIADPSDRREMLLVLFERLAELDPLSALALARTPGFAAEGNFEREVWRRWGETDLDAALAQAATLDGVGRTRAAQGLFAASGDAQADEAERIADRLGAQPDNRTRSARIDDLASSDPAAAVGYVQTLASPLHRRQAAAHLGRLLGRNGLEGADRWSALFQEPGLARAFEDAAAQSAAEVDPAGTLAHLLAAERSANGGSRLASAFTAVAAQDIQQALAWYEEIDDPGQRRSVGRAIAVQLAQSDPQAALAWVAENDRSLEQSLYMTVIGTIAETNPELAVENAKRIDNRWHRMSALSTVAYQVAEDDPRRAADLAKVIDDEEVRSMMMQRVAMNWMQSDPEAAIDWVMSSEISDRDEVMMAAAFMLSRSDVDAAIELLPRLDEKSASVWRQQIAANLASQRSIAQARSFIARFEGTADYPQLVAGMLQGLAQTDPRAAVEMLKDVPDDPQRQMLSASVFMMYAQQSPREAAEAAAALATAEERSAALPRVVEQWTRADPQAAEQWVERLPRGADRDGAIASLAGRWDELTPSRRRLVDSIDDVEQRSNAITQVVFRIAREDRERAEQALASFDLPAEQREQLLEYLRNFRQGRSFIRAY